MLLRIYLCSLFLVVVSTNCSRAQSQFIHLTIDNDSFLFSQTDWYYSSGIYASYNKELTSNGGLINPFRDKERKVIRSIGITHQIYTPRFFNSPDVRIYDRPHAALFQVDYRLSYAKEVSILSLQGSAGWMGPALGTGPVLVWFHDVLGYRRPRGWDYEISNTPAIQLNLGWQQTLFSEDWVDLNLDTEANLGTVFIDAGAGAQLRLGRFLPIGNSILYDQLTDTESSRKMIELFAIVGTRVDYSIYNATIEGGFIGADSPHTESPMQWNRNAHFGVGLGGKRFDSMLLLNYQSPSTTEADRHKYVTIKMNYRL